MPRNDRGKKGDSKGERNRRFRFPLALATLSRLSSHSPFSEPFVFFAGRATLASPAVLGPPWGRLDGAARPADNRKRGEWERTTSKPRRSGSCWPPCLIGCSCLARPFASRPA